MKKIKKILPRVAFVLALLCAVGLLQDTLLIKRFDGITPMRAYYDQPADTVDVLIVGSSHAGANLSTQTLWDEYGISSFVLWGSIQPFWNTYHSLIEALKTQTPKLVVLEMYAATFDFEYSDEARQVANTAGMRLSPNKWQALKASAPPERRLDLLTVMPVIHARYSELDENDFQYFPWNDLSTEKGAATMGYTVLKMENVADAKAVSEVRPLMEKEQIYLDKIIALCQEKQLPLLLVTTPTIERDTQQPYYNRVAQIADENGLPYLNCNLLDKETGFDFARDFYDSHTNERGTKKITRFLAEYIKKNYDIPDHRGDPRYESWEISSRTLQNDRLVKITESKDYFEELASSRYICYLVKEYGQYPMTAEYKELIEEITQIDDAQAHISRAMEDEWGFDVAFQCAGSPAGENRLLSEEEKAEIGFALDSEERNVLFNGQKVSDYEDGEIHLLVYDSYSKTCVDAVKFSAEGKYKLERLSENEEEEE